MLFRTVSMISQNLLDQLTQNFKYTFSTRVTTAPTRIDQKILLFYIFWGLPKFNKNVQKSIIELQSIATFLIIDFSLLFWYLVILIKEHSRFFFISDEQNGRNHGHRETTFFKSDYVWEYALPLILTFFVPKNFKTSLKYVQVNLVDLTVKGVIVSLQKNSLTKLKKHALYTRIPP